MKNLCKFTVKSPAASYIPLPRFLLLDEELQDISSCYLKELFPIITSFKFLQ